MIIFMPLKIMFHDTDTNYFVLRTRDSSLSIFRVLIQLGFLGFW